MFLHPNLFFSFLFAVDSIERNGHRSQVTGHRSQIPINPPTRPIFGGEHRLTVKLLSCHAGLFYSLVLHNEMNHGWISIDPCLAPAIDHRLKRSSLKSGLPIFIKVGPRQQSQCHCTFYLVFYLTYPYST